MIRLLIATEADPFDVETWRLVAAAVTYHCQLVTESTKKQTKHASRLKQIRYRNKSAPVESHHFTHLNFFVIVQIGKPKNVQYFPSLMAAATRRKQTTSRTKGLQGKKKKKFCF